MLLSPLCPERLHCLASKAMPIWLREVLDSLRRSCSKHIGGRVLCRCTM